MVLSIVGRRAGRAMLALTLSVGVAGPVFALSADAQKVLDQVKKNTPNLASICSDRDKLKTAVTSATAALYKEQALSGDPRAAGQEAGRYLYMHCSG